MALPQSIASTRAEGPIQLRDAPADWLVLWLLVRASFRANPRRASARALGRIGNHFSALPSPTHSFSATRAAPLRFPTTLSQPQTRGWSGNFGVHNKKEWAGEG
jgi:hypothetical protein